MSATIYKCPMCGNDIEVSDTSMLLQDHPNFLDNSVVVRAETTIKHKGGLVDPNCGEFLHLFVREQKDILTKWLEASQKKHSL